MVVGELGAFPFPSCLVLLRNISMCHSPNLEVPRIFLPGNSPPPDLDSVPDNVQTCPRILRSFPVPLPDLDSVPNKVHSCAETLHSFDVGLLDPNSIALKLQRSTEILHSCQIPVPALKACQDPPFLSRMALTVRSDLDDIFVNFHMPVNY